MDCEHTRELAAELALGIADGADRARALRHLSECADCRSAVEQLSVVTDELLTLAPEREPPPGFESRVLARLAPRAEPARPWRRRLAPIAAAAAAAALAAGIVLGMTSDDRRLAAQYRATLATANGSSFEAARLRDGAQARAGIVYAYRGRPSWIYVGVYPGRRSTAYRVDLVMASGRRVELPGFRLDPATGSGGRAVPVDVGELAAVRLVATTGGDVLMARFPRGCSRSGSGAQGARRSGGATGRLWRPAGRVCGAWLPCGPRRLLGRREPHARRTA